MFNRACLARLGVLFVVLLFATTAAWADTLVQVNSQAGQGATDSISWKQLGGDQSLLAASFSVKSAQGITHMVSLTGADSVVSVVCSSTPSNCSWTRGTGFATGDSLIWTSDTGNGGTGPVTLTFSAPMAGAGALIQANTPGQFTAKIEAFNGATSLGSFTVTSDTNGDAVYIGLKDQTAANITSVVFSLTTCAGTCTDTDLGIDTAYLNTGLKATSTAVASLLNPSVFGQDVTFTTTVTSTGGTPTGTVTFKDGITTLGTGTLSSGKATFKSSTLAVAGTRSITAVYGGSTSFAGSTSPLLTQTVKQASSSTSLASSLNPSTFGAAVTFTATVTSTGGTPTGAVTFKDGITTLGTGTLSSGKATFKTSTLAVGAHSITEVYGGSTSFAGSTSPSLTQTVKQGTPPIVTGNILTNGNFSNGLHCFSDWGWYKDYQFALSTDYHSPPYAAEIRCTGGSCAKASILVAGLPITPGKSYLLQAYTKCKTGGRGDIFIGGYDSTGRFIGSIDPTITCNGNWNKSLIYYTPGPAATSITFEIFSRTAVPLLIDDLVLTYADGTVPAQNPWAHPGIRNVSVSNSTVSVDGKPYLALGFSSVPPSAFAQVAALGANTLAAPSEINSDCYATGGKDVLDQAYELGLNVLPDTTYAARAAYDHGTLSANGGGGILTLPDIVTRYGRHLANIGWFLDDEPDLDAYGWYPISPLNLISEGNAIRSKSSLPVLADFQHAHYDMPTVDAPYNGSVDIWMAEPYGNSSNPGFTYVTHAINLLDGIQKRPIWLFQNDITASLMVPKAYWAIVNGATGILYFSWPAFASTADEAQLKAAGQVFSELGSLKDVIFAPSVSVTAPTGVTAIARQYQGKTYIFAVNPTTTPITGSFSVAGLTSGKVVTVEFENRSITASSSGITDTFSGITRHVYVFQ